ncbi:C40 family peptidase [Streptomyces tsukubensis]|uniref:Glycoside hydrolase n=1 Tax=Streptomyces tsukubensis TaxID=83656 RepID=A0A1V4A867_9ACTN|nr:C40 family peptidase [Streptomyces tsukubensis]OON78823.1 glycoside hydrolase [Streptomyces tsukubensis]QFR97791.1 glycoside hydrolase [Streptomyces tsukubensis]
MCATTVLLAPGTAFASPEPPPDGAPAAAKSTQQLEKVRQRIETLYHRASVATEAYNAAKERTDKQSAQVEKVNKAIAKGEKKLEDLKSRMGAAARAQYRGGALSPEARVLLSDDPRQFLDRSTRAEEGRRAGQNLMSELTSTQETLDTRADDAAALWKKLESGRKKKASAAKEIKKQIKSAESLEAKLRSEERARLKKLEEAAARRAQAGWLESGAVKIKGGSGKASTQGEKAVAYATAQLGKPYVWGATGPSSFDCSGLTSQAWNAAGHAIPRTSQEQWKQLPQVDVKDMRPGDLIIYHADASHVGLYIGDGKVVHAPRPGRDVTVAGAGSMRILGVVRPDGAGE